ncbi:MAG: DUF2813 domain-containing protein [Bacteroidetes bacterium]|nr:MAG: DUF2813 domain-containing protein [Bacteroidota bacterium]
MKIKTVEINNWRSIKNTKFDLQDLMIFIGQNNHGKSNILSALLFFFGEIKYNDLDFNEGENSLYIEIEFENLDENDKITFKRYLTSKNNIKVRKQIKKGEDIEYHGYLENPSEDWLKIENYNNYNNRDKVNDLPINQFLPSSGRITKDIYNQAIEDYINKNRAAITFNYEMELGPFLGARNVAQGIFGEVFYIPSVKDANTELSLGTRSSSIFNQLYSRVINQISESSIQYKEAKEKITILMKILNKETDDGKNNEERPIELSLLERSIEEELKSWQTTIDVEITPPNIDDIFKVGAFVWINDGIKTDITRKGHGLQRAMIFALVKSWANLLKDEKNKEKVLESSEDEQDENKKSKRKASDSAYFIFEEPELYLHPQAQRELYSSLIDLSKNKNQVLLCTHSSSFIDIEQYKSICIVKRENIEKGTKVFQYLENLFENPLDKKDFNLIYWINPERSELFFANKVILVEGQTDKTVIPFLAKKINIFKYDYTIIDCGGKDCMKYYINLLNKFCIPYCSVYDKDHQTYKLIDAINSADISSKEIENLIISNYGYSVIFDNDIEEELGIMDISQKNKPYYALSFIDKPDYILLDSLKEKIEKIYK